MSEFEEPNENTLKWKVQDGSRDEAYLRTLQNIVDNTGGGIGNVINKFGFNSDIDTTTDPEIIASFGGAFEPLTDVITTAQTFTITYDTTTNGGDGSTGTGARMLQFSYLDENFIEQTGLHTLGSGGSDTTSFSGVGINRIVVIAFGSVSSNNNDITITATTDGTTQAQIPAGKSVTQQCLYHTEINKTFKMNFIKASVLKVSGGGGSPVVNIVGYSYSRVTKGRYAIFDLEVDTSIENNVVIPMTDPIIFTGREIIYFEAETDTNNTKVSMRFAGTLTDS